MERVLGGYSGLIFTALRVVSGVMFACHGAQQMTGNPLMLVAGIIEFGGGLLIAIGLVTGIAAFISSGEMAVAYFMAHASNGFWPIVNKGELAVVYCFVFLYIAAHGAGTHSVDHAMRKGR